MRGVDYISLSAGGKFEDAVHKDGEVFIPTPVIPATAVCHPWNIPDGYNPAHGRIRKRRMLRRHGYRNACFSRDGEGSRPPNLPKKFCRNNRADLIGMARALA